LGDYIVAKVEHDTSRAPRARFGGLGARLVAAQLLVATLLLGVAWLSWSRSQETEARIVSLYQHRILPLHRLGRVADAMAIDFVDAVHKVSDGAVTPAEGAARLERVRAEAARVWREAELVMTASGDRQVLDDVHPNLAAALGALSRAQALMNAGDLDALISYRRSELYSRVDPLTGKLHEQIKRDITLAHRDLSALQAHLARTTTESATALTVVGILAVLVGVLVASRFVVSLRRIERVVQGAAAGDLSLRVQLSGADELSGMAARIDAMIAAIEKSQSELSRQTEALSRSESEARAANAAKSVFLGNVSHELRTPLNVILGYAQALERARDISSDMRRGLSRIGEAGSHLLALIDDVIGVARMDAGALVLHPTPFSPAELLTEIERMVGPRARAKSIELVTRAREPLPKTVSVDRRRLLQILLNLTGNAVKFTPRGSVTVEMSWEDEQLWVAVADTGPGIDEAEQAELFHAFSQGELGKKSGEGTGLGLHISRQLAQAMGGDLTLQSHLGKGSTFTCHVEAPESLPLAERERQSKRLRAAPEHTLAPMLVVDDRAANREVLCALLRVVGFDAAEAASGPEALAYLEERAASLVWLDVKMPGMDGFEVIRRIRSREAERGAPRTPVVVITASVVELDRRTALGHGFDELVAKPFRAEAVLDAIARLTRIALVADTHTPTDEPLTPVSERFDIANLTPQQRSDLKQVLALGDIEAALELATGFGAGAAALTEEISSFRTDALLAKLRAFD
jgi:signal transduction histidine kinase/CheY-like chemotaxis protein